MTNRNSAKPNLRLHQAVARKLGVAILSGDISPGAGFDSEIEHSAALGVSRTAYREAMKILVAKGLLESRPKVGTHVRPRQDWNLLDPEVLMWMFAEKPDQEFVNDLFELRGIIEPAAAELAAKRRTDAQLEDMRRALATMREKGLTTEAGREADQEFHRIILDASGNMALLQLASSMGTAIRLTTEFKKVRQKLPRDSLPDHDAVFEALAERSPKKARATMAELVRLALADMTYRE